MAPFSSSVSPSTCSTCSSPTWDHATDISSPLTNDRESFIIDSWSVRELRGGDVKEKRLIRHRAVHDEQKEERRQAILEAARRLFQTSSYEALTIASVATALGLAKGTVYLYFKTKEELFLALVEQQLAAWFAEVDAGLAALLATKESCTIPQVTAVLCRALEARPDLMRLLAILHPVLEYNINLEAAVRFKLALREHFSHTGSLLERCLPFLHPGDGAHLLLQCDAIVIGLWHLSDPAPVVQQALQQPGLHVFNVHFASELATLLQTLLYGLECRTQKNM
ncbi:MAG: TetR family transcriptional regulator [Ktedonobacteraceae bacterium]|nr:TetR family transcriptional regulator [Ktedonobacteraceae bacterium]